MQDNDFDKRILFYYANPFKKEKIVLEQMKWFAKISFLFFFFTAKQKSLFSKNKNTMSSDASHELPIQPALKIGPSAVYVVRNCVSYDLPF
ncbi:MAG: hypothetical protein NTV32_10755 [Gammaproteobacteria bacterium]|nr:hypothetical protein [Gammaproteobacteria bacterium]